jgi:flagellar biosynthetic protein FlhB
VALMALVVPVALAATIGGLVATVAQVGMHIETDGLGFNVERLNPWPRFARLFTPGPAITELIMSTARVGVVGYFAWRALQDEIPALLRLADLPPGAALGASARALGAVVLRVLFALGVLAVLDYLYSWFSLEKRMKMSLKEIKEESRSQEGDPKVKAKLRSKARALAKQRMMASVKRADVIVTNPTHYAVALRYSPKDPAPIVVAKGVDEVALQIRKEARKYGIPILESRALARALHADVAIGNAVPGAHFVAVARILAFVYRLRPRKAPCSA